MKGISAVVFFNPYFTVMGPGKEIMLLTLLNIDSCCLHETLPVEVSGAAGL